MNRRNFIKSAAAVAALTPAAIASSPLSVQPDKKPPAGLYQVNCYVWSYESSTYRNFTRGLTTPSNRVSDLWTDPDPSFSNIDSAVEFINDHKNIWDLKLVNVSYDITFYPNDNHCMYKVGSYNYNSAGTTQWLDRPPHQRYDHDSF